MPWKSSTPVDLRIEFMNRVMRGEPVAQLCREYGISRKTGDKFKQRFKRLGEAGLVDQSRAPKVVPHRTPPELVELLLAERKRHPSWGPVKLKAVLEDRLKCVLPAPSTIGDVLTRAGLVQRRQPRRRTPARPTRCGRHEHPTTSGASTTKASFGSAIARFAIRSRSLTNAAVSFSGAKA